MFTTSLDDVTIRFGPMGRPAGCRICGKPLTFHQQVSWQICDQWQCKKALLEKALVAHRGVAAGAVGECSPESYPVVVVPDDPVDIDRLPQPRKQAYINFLYDLSLKVVDAGNVAVTGAQETESSDLQPPAVLAANVCGVCRGTCCHQGNEHAFLDEAAIGRFIALSRITDPLEIVYAYAVHLPTRSAVGACVYQTDRGCALPRWMRAAICNGYRCKGLEQAERMIRENDIERLFVAVRRDNRISRSAFVRRHTIRHYPLQDPVRADPAALTISKL
ncbi:hypothetical protein DSCA_11220 [Desulfosarcina alkanivorans]|uniref:Uncharacterized protein n=1 Tax=Desulfosarcina alkanivorans TaxID=571177 RepID=A0A5K7YCM3_9BACT|nr:hypothetical protein [Desulfosarcina alkanivorans]BBO67192.1 hypothetical protein DSCA_11220 [Desulfosarcina alkanivorans]